MSAVENLNDLIVWATDGGNVCEFLDEVLDLIHNKFGKFVTIEEIAKERNWQFEGHAGYICYLCSPITVLPDIETREDEDDALMAYKYKPDTPLTEFEIDFCSEAYGEFIDRVIEDLKEIKRENDLKNGDAKLEEIIRQL
ncbi:MAG: hypothetical protein JW878_09330 [Methanomicrobia archaeon]|nr:hypothetical protein [Methanomicrobia archaeon]